MTQAEALQEARRRWGASVNLQFASSFIDSSLVRVINLQKRWKEGFGQKSVGWGDSWEAAFADAERREKNV